jgi:hypothetical protein
MSKQRLILAVLAFAALAVAPVVALADGGEHERRERLLLGFTLHFTGPSTTAGSFIASGAVKAAGDSAVEDLSLVPFPSGDRARLTGTQRFTTPDGVLVTRFRGVAHDISTPHQWAKGSFRIIDATGQYAGLRGNGGFTIVVDTQTNQLTGTEVGRVHGID